MISNDIKSNYPSRIDPWIFFQDLTNVKEEYFTQFRKMTSAQSYEKAHKYAHDKEVDIFDADVMATFQNRLFALQTYLSQKTKKSLITYNSVDPGATVNVIYDVLATQNSEEITTESGEEILAQVTKQVTHHYGDLDNKLVWISDFETEPSDWIIIN